MLFVIVAVVVGVVIVVAASAAVGVAMFDQERNQQDLKNGGRETKLGFMCHVDFEMQGVKYGFDDLNGKPMVCYYLTKVIKPARYKQ